MRDTEPSCQIDRARFSLDRAKIGDGFGIILSGFHGELLASAALLITLDTGIAHLAKLVGVPTIALFGPGSSVLLGRGNFWRDAPFREVTIPIRVLGKLFLHSMPGCHESLDHVWESLKAKRIAAIICLAGEDEILAKSHAYGEALRYGSVPCGVIRFEIPDYGVPEDRDAFLLLACDSS